MSEYDERFVKVPDGLDIFYRDYPGPSQTDRLPVLCLHGLTRNSADFETIAPRLAEDRRVLAMDVRGRGRSQWDPDWRRYHPGSYVADAFALMDHEGIDRAILIGTSMGGIMSMIMGAMAPTRFAGMVLNDIGPKVEEAGVERISGYVGKMPEIRSWADAVEATRTLNEAFFPDLDEAEWKAFARRLFHEDEEGRPVPAYDPAIRRNFTERKDEAAPDLWAAFEACRDIPILVLRGETSDILSPETVAEMYRRHPKTHAVTVPNRGHAPLLDEPAAIEAIDDFLKTCDSGA
ncbi:MAG: alpha/beta hydrolase [Alphaproteobacteria bacterium]|nr:MAG: alpha/beta hydrolase [Alphaproteobacteria bacterium]